MLKLPEIINNKSLAQICLMIIVCSVPPILYAHNLFALKSDSVRFEKLIYELHLTLKQGHADDIKREIYRIKQIENKNAQDDFRINDLEIELDRLELEIKRIDGFKI